MISAAAGSGGAAVLTECTVARVLDPKCPVDIDESLIVAFTCVAITEMREYIRRRPEDCLQQALRDGEPGIAARVKRESAELDAAQAATIGSLYLAILREHADRFAANPALRTGNEGELRILRNNVLEGFLEEQYEKVNPAFLRFADAFSQGKADLGTGKEILTLYRFTESLPWPEEWLLHVEAEAERTDDNLSESTYRRCVAEELRKFGAEPYGFTEEAQLLCEGGDLNDYEGAIQSDLGKLQCFRTAGDYLAAYLASTASQTHDRFGRNRKDSGPDCASRVKSLWEFWKKALKKSLGAFGWGGAGTADGAEDAETTRTLTGLTHDFLARFLTKKRGENFLDFSDLEYETLALLWESNAMGRRYPNGIVREYQAAFRETYIDRYQDSNGVQEELLRAIEIRRLLPVGDTKQLIYDFRHAKPGLFAEKYRNYRKDSGGAVESGTDTRADLRKNFRSREAVLANCNATSSCLMYEELGGIRYDAGATPYPGTAFPIPEGSKGSYVTELTLIERDAEGEKIVAVAEVEAIATHIREPLDPVKGFRISDGKGGFRVAAHSDIAILFRATPGQAKHFAEMLMSHGIPVLAEQRADYFDAAEARTVLSLLRVIDSPFRDTPLAAVLRTLIDGLSEEELASPTAKGEGVSLCKRLEVAVAATSGNMGMVKVTAPFRKFEARREAKSHLELPQFLRFLYIESGYRGEEVARLGGELRPANPQMLTVEAEKFEGIGCRELSDFARYTDNLKKYNVDYGSVQLPGEEAAAARITAMHRLKGLEFPIVFLAGLSKRLNQRDLSRGILYDEKLDIVADAVDYDLHVRGGTAEKMAFAWHLRMEALGEGLRVLYAATMCAKEKLIPVTGFEEETELLPEGENSEPLSEMDSDEPLCTTELRSANSYLEWVLIAVTWDKALCRIIPQRVSNKTAMCGIFEMSEEVLRLQGEL